MLLASITPVGSAILARYRLASGKSFDQQADHLHVSEALGAVQDTLHPAIQLSVVVWLDVEHELLIWHSQIPGKGQLIRPAQTTASSRAPCLDQAGMLQSPGEARHGFPCLREILWHARVADALRQL